MSERTRKKTMKTIRQDLSFVVGVLLLLTVVLAAAASLSSDEAEVLGLGDDLHGLMGWIIVALTVLHTILCWSQMVNYAKRRLRNRLGVGGVIESEAESVSSGPLDYLLDPAGLLSDVTAHGGLWVYGVLFVIVFAETGLVFAPFLPGDSLLFAAGALAGAQRLELWVVVGVVLAAAVAGDAVNYVVGRTCGPRIVRRSGRLLKRRHIEATQGFFRKHGGKAVVLARFVPVVRTFAPFVAGLGGMSLARFWRYNILGAVAWVALFVSSGYFFGTVPWVESNLTLVILGIVGVSVLPLLAEAGRRRWSKRNESETNEERNDQWIAQSAERD